jgi:membrane-bound inhibitor of C-type lysozyme
MDTTTIRACTSAALVLLASACAHRGANPKSTPTPQLGREEIAPRNAYVCDNGQNLATQLDVAQGQLAVSMGQSWVRLDQVPSPSGTKYSNGAVAFSEQGDHAFLEMDGVTTQCQHQLGL